MHSCPASKSLLKSESEGKLFMMQQAKRKQPAIVRANSMNSVKNVSMLFGWSQSGRWGLAEMEKPLPGNSSVLPNVHPSKTGEQHRLERIPRSPSHPHKLQSPHCSTVWVSLPHTPRSFITHSPLSVNFTSQSLYRSLWTLFCLALLSLFRSSRSLSLITDSAHTRPNAVCYALSHYEDTDQYVKSPPPQGSTAEISGGNCPDVQRNLCCVGGKRNNKDNTMQFLILVSRGRSVINQDPVHILRGKTKSRNLNYMRRGYWQLCDMLQDILWHIIMEISINRVMVTASPEILGWGLQCWHEWLQMVVSE